MADIVRLEENGVPKYIETHAQAVVGLKDTITEHIKTNAQIIFDGVVLWNDTQSYRYDIDKLTVGIQLVFSRYDKANWKELDYGFNTVTISKEVLKQYSTGQLFYAAMPDLTNAGVVKQFKVSKTHLTGTAANTDVGAYALRKIIGF